MFFIFIHEQSNYISESSHFPVMLNEVLNISPANGGNFLDCTFGGGGYCKEILKFSKTKVQALDRDEKALLIDKT